MFNRIRELRQERGISMAKAAQLLGIPYTTYVNYEKCEREPNSEMLILIANFFNVSVDYLIGAGERESTGSRESITDEEIKFALFGGDAEITDEMYEEVKRFAAYVKERQKKG